MVRHAGPGITSKVTCCFSGVFHRILKKIQGHYKTRFGRILFIPENSMPYTKKFSPCDSSIKESGSSRHEKVYGLTADRY